MSSFTDDYGVFIGKIKKYITQLKFHVCFHIEGNTLKLFCV